MWRALARSSSMKFLILNTDYPAFLRSLYEQHSGLKEQPFAEQMRVRCDSLFSDAGFYSNSLRALGHEAWDIRANNEFAQKAWMREHGLKLRHHVQLQVRRWRSSVPFILMAYQWFEEA